MEHHDGSDKENTSPVPADARYAPRPVNQKGNVVAKEPYPTAQHTSNSARKRTRLQDLQNTPPRSSRSSQMSKIFSLGSPIPPESLKLYQHFNQAFRTAEPSQVRKPAESSPNPSPSKRSQDSAQCYSDIHSAGDASSDRHEKLLHDQAATVTYPKLTLGPSPEKKLKRDVQRAARDEPVSAFSSSSDDEDPLNDLVRAIAASFSPSSSVTERRKTLNLSISKVAPAPPPSPKDSSDSWTGDDIYFPRPKPMPRRTDSGVVVLGTDRPHLRDGSLDGDTLSQLSPRHHLGRHHLPNATMQASEGSASAETFGMRAAAASTLDGSLRASIEASPVKPRVDSPQSAAASPRPNIASPLRQIQVHTPGSLASRPQPPIACPRPHRLVPKDFNQIWDKTNAPQKNTQDRPLPLPRNVTTGRGGKASSVSSRWGFTPRWNGSPAGISATATTFPANTGSPRQGFSKRAAEMTKSASETDGVPLCMEDHPPSVGSDGDDEMDSE